MNKIFILKKKTDVNPDTLHQKPRSKARSNILSKFCKIIFATYLSFLRARTSFSLAVSLEGSFFIEIFV